MAVGCQRYEARPLNLDRHASTWRGRTPDDPAVHDFLRRSDLRQGPDVPATFDPSDGLSLEEAEVVALVFNADVRLARLKAGVARATAEHSGLWIDPTFEVDVLRILSSVSSPWIISPGLALTVPLSGRLGIEKEHASALFRVELVRAAEAEWFLRHELRQSWVLWSAMHVRAREAARFIDLLEHLTERTGHLAQAGEMSPTESSLFAIERSLRRIEAARWATEADQIELRIKRLMGLAPEARLDLLPLSELALAAPTSRPATHADDIAATSLSLARLREEYEAAEQSLRGEISRQYPDLAIGPLYENDQGQSRLGVLGGMTLPIFNRNRQGIAEARAQREVAMAAYEIEYERLVSELARLEAQLERVRQEQEAIQGHLLPLVERQAADAHRLLELGEVDTGGTLILLESLRRAHEIALDLVQLQVDQSLAELERQYLLGPHTELAAPAVAGDRSDEAHE